MDYIRYLIPVKFNGSEALSYLTTTTNYMGLFKFSFKVSHQNGKMRFCSFEALYAYILDLFEDKNINRCANYK